MRALIVDDSKAMRLILRKMLSSLGFEVIEALDGSEGLEQMRRFPDLDLVCVDSHMPQMEGTRFVEIVRGNPAYDEIRLMMVTSDDHEEAIAAALRAGANEYLTKPFTTDAVVKKLQRVGVVPSCA